MSNLRINWIRNRIKPTDSSVDLYRLYGEFEKQFGPTNKETFKRYARQAYALYQETAPRPGTETASIHVEEDRIKNTVFYEVKSKNVRTIEDLIAFAEIDTEIWECTKVIANKWGSEDSPLTQIKGWFQRKSAEDFTPESYAKRFRELVDTIQPPNRTPPKTNKEATLLTEIAIFDHHYGQLSWGDETGGSHYDLKIAASMYEQAIDHFVEKLGHKTERWLFPIGNDFFNADNAMNTTYAGTPQVEDGRWQKTFTTAEKLIIEQIDKLLEYAPVDIVIVPGNHDRSRIFYFGEFLSAWYRNTNFITVDNGPRKHKFYSWGNVLLMFTHGDGIHKGALPLFVAQDQPEAFARAQFVEIHKGHFHSASEKKYQLSKNTFGIREEVLPSLVARDDWHDFKGYNSQRESMAICYTELGGRDSVHYWHPLDI